ncbi:hypothetical protein AVEN_256668-1 [Araneus ventricosus]|uniref:Uncharacterized protein n=1 Tax=Araneus ventricosus TaxID=182803 RepID=A0A4Y2QIV5_ARAVE|nr:hypothetical protein AVEN_48634-1 [Araneus ventricosus]GBN63239.1 hypothetical protein AVEN_256668-1 [Araneus ventricosus]
MSFLNLHEGFTGISQLEPWTLKPESSHSPHHPGPIKDFLASDNFNVQYYILRIFDGTGTRTRDPPGYEKLPPGHHPKTNYSGCIVTTLRTKPFLGRCY